MNSAHPLFSIRMGARNAHAAGLLGHVALDGTKIKANASKHKAMSYERMEKRAAELEAEVERRPSVSEGADAEEDRAFGRAQRAARSCPNGSPTRRSAPRRSGRRRPNWRPRRKRPRRPRPKRRPRSGDKPRAARNRGRPAAPPSEEPDPKAQKNFTDPESRIMKTKDGFIQGYNAQAAVDATAQAIVAHGLDAKQSDQHQFR